MRDLLLAIDTCTGATSIALRDADGLLGEHTWRADRHHSAAVSARIRALLQACRVAPDRIGAIAIALGPGSFTGVRCGLSIAKGMAVAGGASLIGVNAFDVIAAAQPAGDLPMAALIEAGRQRVAVQRYEPREGAFARAGDWSLNSWNQLGDSITQPTWICGDVPPMLRSNRDARIAPVPLNLRRAGFLAELARERWVRGDVDDAMTLAPIYPSPEKVAQ